MPEEGYCSRGYDQIFFLSDNTVKNEDGLVRLILMEHNYERNKSLVIVFDYTSFFSSLWIFFTFWTD